MLIDIVLFYEGRAERRTACSIFFCWLIIIRDTIGDFTLIFYWLRMQADKIEPSQVASAVSGGEG